MKIININWLIPSQKKIIDPGTATVVGGIGGSILSGIFGRSSAKRSMAFQEKAARSAHQWEVEDLRKAGLNPILSATGGSGASVGGGAMPQTPDFTSSALGAMRLKQEIINMKAMKEKTDAETIWTQNKGDIAGPLADIARLLSRQITTPGSSGISSAIQVIRSASERRRAREKRAKTNVKAWKANPPFKRTATPLYDRETY